MTQTIDFTHTDEDGTDVSVHPSTLGTDNILINIEEDDEGGCVRVPGPALRDALLEAFPLPVAKDDCCELAEWERELLGVEEEPKPEHDDTCRHETEHVFEEGDRVSYDAGRYLELRNRRGSGTVHAVHDNGAITVTQDGGSNFTYFEHELTPLDDVEVEEDTDPVAVVNAAHEYAETAAQTAYAAALVEFISGVSAE